MLLQANERDALREAGRRKLDEYRKLKAALLNGDFIDVQMKQRTFSNSNLAAAAGTSTPPPEQQEQQQPESSVRDSHDPMVDVLLSQVGVMAIVSEGRLATVMLGLIHALLAAMTHTASSSHSQYNLYV